MEEDKKKEKKKEAKKRRRKKKMHNFVYRKLYSIISFNNTIKVTFFNFPQIFIYKVYLKKTIRLKS